LDSLFISLQQCSSSSKEESRVVGGTDGDPMANDRGAVVVFSQLLVGFRDDRPVLPMRGGGVGGRGTIAGGGLGRTWTLVRAPMRIRFVSAANSQEMVMKTFMCRV